MLLDKKKEREKQLKQLYHNRQTRYSKIAQWICLTAIYIHITILYKHKHIRKLALEGKDISLSSVTMIVHCLPLLHVWLSLPFFIEFSFFFAVCFSRIFEHQRQNSPNQCSAHWQISKWVRAWVFSHLARSVSLLDAYGCSEKKTLTHTTDVDLILNCFQDLSFKRKFQNSIITCFAKLWV